MNGRMFSHWGLVTWPDNEWLENIVVNEDGALEKFDDALPLKIQSKMPYYDKAMRTIKLRD